MLLAPRQFAGLGVAIQVNERFGGGNSGFPPPPARDHLLMLAPDTLPVLAHMPRTCAHVRGPSFFQVRDRRPHRCRAETHGLGALAARTPEGKNFFRD